MFIIVKIQRTNPIIYSRIIAENPSLKRFMSMSCIALLMYLVEKVLRRKGDKVYIKWLEFDGSHNSWTK